MKKWKPVPIDALKASERHSLVGGPFGSNLTRRDYIDAGVPVIRGVNLPNDRKFSEDEFVFVSEAKADELRQNCAHRGDVVFTQRGTLGQVGLIPESSAFNRYVISQSQMKLTVDTAKADAEFVYYFFRHPHTVQLIKNKAISSGVPHINLGILKEIEIPLPGVEVQREIVKILRNYDNLIENNRRRIALLEDASRQLYKEWFIRLRFPGHEHTSIMKGIPEGWKKTTAYEAMEVLSGGTPKTTISEYWDGGIPFYTPKDATETCYVLETERSISEVGLKNCNSRLYKPDTVFISARGTVGKLNLAAREMAMSQSCYALIGKGHITQLFLFCALKEAIEHFKQHAVGAVFDAIIVDTFKLIPFLVPTEKKVRDFEDAVWPMFRQLKNLIEQNEKLVAARDLLLPRLLSGEIAV
jgi:type I restriction enzyme, S subunit